MPNPSATPPRVTRLEGAVLALVLIAAATVRIRLAASTPLWFDELYSLSASSRPLADVLAVVRSDVHPPLHFLWLWAWHAVGGGGDLWLRMSSIVCALGAIFAGWALARTLFGRYPAALAAAMLALDPAHASVSQELRSYPMLWLWVTLAALGAARWHLWGRRGDAALFVLAAAAALWTHYLAGVVLFVQWVWGLFRLGRDGRRQLEWSGLHVAVAVLFAPLLPLWWGQLHRVSADHWMPKPSLLDLGDLGRRAAFDAWYILPVLVALALLPFRRPRRRPAASFAWAVGPGTAALCWTLHQAGTRLFMVKYMLLIIPFLHALAAAGILQLRWPRLRVVVAVLVLLFAARATLFVHRVGEPESLARLREFLAPRAESSDVVLHADTHTLLWGWRYVPQARHRLVLVTPLHYYDGAAVIPDSSRTTPDEVRMVAGQGDRWWGLATDQAGIDVRPVAAVFDSLAPSRTFGLIRLWRPHLAP